ncbi:MAG: hypothetical protein Q8P42_00640, partial [Gallionella sp.]|nr:hypothetical protein [Gallionella sp.]
TSQRLQTYLRLELRGVGFTLLRFAHFFSSFMTAHILNCCLENRVHYTQRRQTGVAFFLVIFSWRRKKK